MDIDVDDFTLQQFIENYVSRSIDKHIGEYIQFQMKGVIEARLAALKLHDPNFPSVDEHITAALGGMIDARLRGLLPDIVALEVKRNFRQLGN